MVLGVRVNDFISLALRKTQSDSFSPSLESYLSPVDIVWVRIISLTSFLSIFFTSIIFFMCLNYNAYF